MSKPGKDAGKGKAVAVAGDDDAIMRPEDAQLAIARAAQRKPQIQAVREKLQKLADDEDRGLKILASAIRNLLHQE